MILMHGIYNKLLDDLVGIPMAKYGKRFDENFPCQARSIHFENKVGTSGHLNLKPFKVNGLFKWVHSTSHPVQTIVNKEGLTMK